MRCLPGFLVLLFSGFLVPGFAQNQPPADCYDVVYLRDGSNYRGQILEMHPDGGMAFETWNKHVMNLLPKQISKVKQTCPCSEPVFEHPIGKVYNATRLSIMPGTSEFSQSFDTEKVLGAGILHTTGYQFSKWVGAGLGIGFEHYGGSTPFVYPIFAEFRSYLTAPKKISPYAAFSGGYSPTTTNAGESFNNDKWYGGWVAKGEFGLVCGNHFTLHGGLSFQAMERRWTNDWNLTSGTDQILLQRLVFGIGLRW